MPSDTPQWVIKQNKDYFIVNPRKVKVNVLEGQEAIQWHEAHYDEYSQSEFYGKWEELKKEDL